MKKIVRYLVIAYAIYLALMIVVVTPLLNFLPHKFLKDNYSRELNTKILWFNPFTLSLEIREAALPELNGEKFVALDSASINISTASLWRDGLVFDKLSLQGLYAHAIRRPTGDFNFSDLLASDTGTQEAEVVVAPETEPSDPLGITVQVLDLHSALIIVTDEARATPYSSQWPGLHIQAVDLSTVLEEGKPYSIELADEAGGQLSWEGQLSLATSHSEGKLELSNLALHTFWRFAEPWVQFELRDGQLHAAAEYSIDWNDGFIFALNNSQLSLTEIDIVPQDSAAIPETAITLKSLAITGISVASTEQHASIDQLTIDGLQLEGFSTEERVSLQELFAMSEATDSSATPSTEETAPGAADEKPNGDASWSVALANAQLDNSQVYWRSQFTDPPRMEIEQISAKLENLSWPLAGESPMSLKLSANQSADLALTGTLALKDGNGNLQYDLQTLPLKWFNPALPKAFKASIPDGQLTSKGQTELESFVPTQVRLDALVQKLAIRRDGLENTLAGWNALQLTTLTVDIPGSALAIQEISLDGLTGSVHIAKDGTLNTSSVWQADDPGNSGVASADLASGDDAATPDATADAAEGEAPAWSVRIPSIQIDNAAIDFQDASLPIEFRTVIQDLSGSIEGLDSAADSSAKVDLNGSVDGYAPVSLVGSLNPLKAQPSLDLQLKFSGVDLARVTPYSGTYAGYAINRGLLNLDLKYELQDNALKGHNAVVIDQLQLGNSVDSEKALNLPLKLALSLLTNSEGVIDMQVPVKGNVDDPKFGLGSVIGGAFVNLLTKAVTAPFSLLANLVSSDADLQHINFAPGAAVLTQPGTEKLKQLGTALAQRPALSLVIAGRVNPEADRLQLQAQALQLQLLADGLGQESLDNRDDDWKQRVAKRYLALPDASAEEVSAKQQMRKLQRSIAIDDGQLLQLAESRATAVKAYLINEAGLTTDRAVIEKAQLDGKPKPFNGVELTVGN